MKEVIVLSARELGYQVVRALGEQGIRSIVIYGNKRDEIAQYSKYVIESYRIPFFKNPELLLSFLKEKGKAWEGALVIPGEDFGVRFLSENRDELSEYYIVPTPKGEIVNRIINKKLLYRFAESIGVRVPKFFTPQSAQELAALKDQIGLPCLLKPGLGHLFSDRYDIKMLEIDSFEQLSFHYERLTDNFTNDEFDLMICEIIPGLDSENMIQYASYLNSSGDLLASMTSIKLRQDPPLYGQGRVVVSRRSDDVNELSVDLLRKLGYYGFSEIEWKYDPRDDSYKLIEINPRFVFYISLCTFCGINFPYIQFQDLVGNEKIEVPSFEENLYFIHLYKDMLHSLLHHNMEDFSITEYLQPYFRKKVFAVLNLRDPKPFVWQWKQHLWNMVRRNLGRQHQVVESNRDA